MAAVTSHANAVFMVEGFLCSDLGGLKYVTGNKRKFKQ